jgi:hypothetical protein
MIDLKTAGNIVKMVVAIAAILTLGDYLGYKIGRWRLATYVWIAALVVVIAFAVYAAFFPE